MLPPSPMPWVTVSSPKLISRETGLPFTDSRQSPASGGVELSSLSHSAEAIRRTLPEDGRLTDPVDAHTSNGSPSSALQPPLPKAPKLGPGAPLSPFGPAGSWPAAKLDAFSEPAFTLASVTAPFLIFAVVTAFLFSC